MFLPHVEFGFFVIWGLISGVLFGWGAWYLWLGLREWWDCPSRHDEGE